jgi:hypothetical protein
MDPVAKSLSHFIYHARRKQYGRSKQSQTRKVVLSMDSYFTVSTLIMRWVELGQYLDAS